MQSGDDAYTLYYVHDPMCSWCYGFKKTWELVRRQLPPNMEIQYLLGGLAPDSQEPMPVDMKTMLEQTWKHIEQQIPGTTFNFDFWRTASPRRSTWPSCRAVIAASEQDQTLLLPMIDAIQMAYYTQARNPSNNDVLVELATTIGCDPDRFEQSLTHPDTHNELLNQIRVSRSMGVQGFPSLVLQKPDGMRIGIPVHYTQSSLILNNIKSH